MATKMTKVPILRAITARSYSQSVPVSGTTVYDIKTSKLANQLVIAAADNQSAISRVSVVFKAGSRYEQPDNLGVTHMLRLSAGLTTKNSSQFAITRHIQQVGANLTCTAEREIIAYTLEGTRAAIEEVIPFLTEVATQQTFRPWELAEQVTRAKIELATRPPQQRAVDLLHKAAFRRGLGNSIYCSKSQLGKIGSETLQHYVADKFTNSRAAIVGLGVDSCLLANYGNELKLASGCGGSGENVPSVFNCGEIRSDKGGNLAYIAIGAQGAAFTNTKEALTFGVLQQAIGGAPKTKYSACDNGPLSKILLGNASATSLNVSYSDAGLFGVLIASEAECANKMVKSAVNMLKGIKLTSQDISRGRNQFKFEVLSTFESGADSIEWMAKSALLTGTPMNVCELAAEIDGVSDADVLAAAQKVAGSKIAIASVGNLRNVPFLDEI